jgi:hypothetical protein
MNNWLRHFRWQSWLLWSGVLLLVIGYLVEQSWRSLPPARALETLLLSLAAWAIAALLRRLLRISLASALACVFGIALIAFVGVLPALATLLVVAGGLALGNTVAGNGRMSMTSAVAGVGAIAGALGWLLPFPVHFRIVYFLLLLILIVVQRQGCRAVLRDGVVAWRAAVDESPAIAAFSVLVVGLASAGCWLPTVQFDDMAYHLGLPSQLVALGYYRMDVQSQIWGLAPWSGDIVQAIAQVLAGAEARGAVDAFWLAAAAVLCWQLATALGAQVYARWLSVALFASLPLTAALVGGMQAELPATAASLALALTVATAPERACLRVAYLFAILAGFLLGLKTGFVAIILALGVWLAWRWRGPWSWKMLVAGPALVFAVGGSSYVYAAVLTGNPLFPLLNGFFHSLLFSGQNLTDPRWTTPIGWDIPWQLTFHTRAYLEGWDGAAGFSLLGLSGAIIVALASPRLRPLALVALMAFIAAIVAVPYFRYAYPALVLLTPVAVTAVALVAPRRNATVLLIAIAVLDLAYQSCAYWTLHVGGIKRSLDHEYALERLAPERILIQTVRQRDATANVLFCSPDAPFAAELAGRGFVTAWYDPELKHAREAADADASGAGWRKMFAYTNAHFAIVSGATISAGLTAALDDTRLLRQSGSAQLWQLPASQTNGNDLARARDLATAKFRP